MIAKTRAKFLVTALAGVALASPALARPGPWGHRGWGAMPSGSYYSHGSVRDPREGKIQVAAYAANSPNAAQLGHGPITVASAPGNLIMGTEDAAYQAAVFDQLLKAAYLSGGPQSINGQLAELKISHTLVEPEEPPHDPVSGQAGVGISNRGSTIGIAVGVDLSKPLKALVATRLDAQIRDRVTNEVLWEGYAKVVSRQGNREWSNAATAARLAAALFKNFPRPS